MANGNLHEGRLRPGEASPKSVIPLIVHEQPSQADQQAEELFRRLADEIEKCPRAQATTLLTVIRVNADEAGSYGALPMVYNVYSPVDLWQGLEGVRKFVDLKLEELR